MKNGDTSVDFFPGFPCEKGAIDKGNGFELEWQVLSRTKGFALSELG